MSVCARVCILLVYEECAGSVGACGSRLRIEEPKRDADAKRDDV